MKTQRLLTALQETLGDIVTITHAKGEACVEVPVQQWSEIAKKIKDASSLHFSVLLDVCAIDYLEYGCAEWRAEETVFSGFSRARSVESTTKKRVVPWDKPRFAIVYHFLSLAHNQRLRVKLYVEESTDIPSMTEIWPSANWYEREIFDLFGLHFSNHPDLRRLLTDYGFQGHPFRKDFPLIGELAMRYDAEQEKCIYEPVDIAQRTLVPRVIRKKT